MKYTYETWTIQKLVELYNGQKLNLNPPYQRNDIWPPLSKKRLIESIKKGYPLPSFFLHDKVDGNYDMIDGQQRTRTFIGYQKGFFSDTDNVYYNSSKDDDFYKSYTISVCLIQTIGDAKGVIEDFYYRVNKYGVKLNRPEMKKAGYAESEFQELVEKLAKEQSFIQLALFSEKSIDRLNDLDFVAELLTLLHHGITDKKITVDKLYDSQSAIDFNDLENHFNAIIQRITDLDGIYPITKTRYKQKNDFYTLFSFIHFCGNEISDELLNYQYKILVLIGPDISPTNEKCWAFQEYANNCVSQSNSKRAREERLIFFKYLLLNKEPLPLEKLIKEVPTEYDTISDAIIYYSLQEKPLKNIEEYYLLDIEELKAIKPEINI